jgi:hypothetical protein
MTVKIELTLAPRKSCLEGLITYDKVNKELLQKVIDSDLIINTEEWNETKQLDQYMFQLLKSKNGLIAIDADSQPEVKRIFKITWGK